MAGQMPVVVVSLRGRIHAQKSVSSSPPNRALRPHHQQSQLHPDLSLPQPHHLPRRRHHRSLAALPAHRRRHRHQPPPRSPLPVSRLPSLPRPSRRHCSAGTRRYHRSLAAFPAYRHRHHQPRLVMGFQSLSVGPPSCAHFLLLKAAVLAVVDGRRPGRRAAAFPAWLMVIPSDARPTCFHHIERAVR